MNHTNLNIHQHRHIVASLLLGLLMIALIGGSALSMAAATPSLEQQLPSATNPSWLGERDNPAACPININVQRSIPTQITNGEAQTLTVFGENFTEDSAVWLNQFGALTTTFVNVKTLTAQIPANIPPGTYNVRLVDPACDDITYVEKDKLKLTVLTPQQPTPTFGIPDTLEPPTPLPGAPALVARNFSTNPLVVPPGGTVSLTFEVYNQGNRTAQGISASLGSSTVFLPSGGQATTILSDLLPGASTYVTLTAVVAQSAEAGPASIPVSLTFRDFSGESYTAEASYSVSIERVVQSTQLILSKYEITPQSVVPGEPVNIRVTVTNMGTIAAEQALIRVAGDGGILLAGPQGDSFPLMDLQPGSSAVIDLPLIAKADAKQGPQAQPFSISYLLNGESQKVDGTMTISVAAAVEIAPVMLIESYTIDRDPLKPGEEFELTVKLKNVGEGTALGLLVTFGTVESTGDGSSGGGSGSGSGGSTSTTPSTNFAPLDSGGTLFVGDVGSDATTVFNQRFIVNGTTVSGVYSLPITLRYNKPAGGTAQDNLRASVVVIKPPSLRAALQAPAPEFVNVGEPITLTYDLFNNGTKLLDMTNGKTEADTGEVVDGKETFIGQIAAGDSGTYTTTIIPYTAGTLQITVNLGYLDDLSNERQITETFEVTVNEIVEPPIEEQPTPDILFPTPTPEPEQPKSDWLGRFLLGLLGLGS